MNELREFKLRFAMAMEHARADKFVLPYRFTVLRTGCGFVVIPLTKEFLPARRNGLQNLTLAHKYEQKLPRCLGVSIAYHSEEDISAEWCYAEFPWEKDDEAEQLLAENDPFRKTSVVELPRYRFERTSE